ncbi:MAG: DUF3983 domain-containing protein [Bacillus sp. (in: firmicutes)]
MSKNKKKKRKKFIARRIKKNENIKIKNAWRNIFVQAGIIK